MFKSSWLLKEMAVKSTKFSAYILENWRCFDKMLFYYQIYIDLLCDIPSFLSFVMQRS